MTAALLAERVFIFLNRFFLLKTIFSPQTCVTSTSYRFLILLGLHLFDYVHFQLLNVIHVHAFNSN